MNKKTSSLPNFFLVGFEKSATTWLYNCLQEHPKIFLPPHRSEVHFFDRNYDKGIDFYRKFYRKSKNEKAVGDMTPSYIQDPNIARLIARNFPHAKIIISLRNPVDRLFSDYLHQNRNTRTNIVLSDYLKNKNYLERSLYYKKVKEYFNLFKKNEIFIIIFEKINQGQIELLQKIFRFLEVDDSFNPECINKKMNKYVKPRNIKIYHGIMGFLKYLRMKHNRYLDHIIEFIKSTGVKNLLVKEKERPRLDSKIRTQLSNYYKEDVKKLSQLTGINFHEYWKI